MAENQETTRRRIHEVKEALNTLNLAIQDIESGYRFDDSLAGDKLKLMKASLASLTREAPGWIEYLRGQIDN